VPSLAKALQIHQSRANAAHLLCGAGWKPNDSKTLVFGVELELEVAKDFPSQGELEEWLETPGGRALLQRIAREYSWVRSTYELQRICAQYMPRVKALGDVMAAVGSGWLIGKEDGSLNNGIEFVSRPDTLHQHRKHWKMMFDGMPKSLRARGNCGLHIHVSKHNLGAEVIGQCVALVTYPNFKRLVEGVAGRSNSTYAKIIQKTKANFRSEGRYEAINTNPAQTFEWRLFASTTQWAEFELRLEFVASVVGWSRADQIDQSEMWSGWERYCRWVARDNKDSERFLTVGKWLEANPHKAVAPPEGVSGELWCRDQDGNTYTSSEQLEALELFYVGTRDVVRRCDCGLCAATINNALRDHTNIHVGRR
jgi:hypothetical protein